MQRRMTILIFAVFALALLVIPAAAQTNTDTPMPSTSSDQSAATATVQAPVAVNHVRIAYLATNGPVLVPYVDGRPSTIQLLQAPAVTGWIDIPVGSRLSLIPQNMAQSQAVVAPLNVDKMSGQWTTVVVLSTGINPGDLKSFAFSENLSNVPTGCARVTLIQGVFGSPAANLTLDNGTVIGSGLAFPDGTTSSSGQTTSAESTPDPMLTQCANMAASSSSSTTTSSTNPVSTLDCQAITSSGGTTGAEATAEATMSTEATAEATMSAESTMEATEEAGGGLSASMGQSFSNCGFTFDLPAGTYNLQLVPAAGGNAISTMGGTQLAADTVYFIAVFGDQNNPQVFMNSVSAASVNALGGSGTTSQPNSSSTVVSPDMTEMPTAEATMAATATP